MYQMNSNQNQTAYDNSQYANYSQIYQNNNADQANLTYQYNQQQSQQLQPYAQNATFQNNAQFNQNQYYYNSNYLPYYPTYGYGQYPFNYPNEHAYYNVPPKSTTPDKQIMNDSGIDSPTILNNSNQSNSCNYTNFQTIKQPASTSTKLLNDSAQSKSNTKEKINNNNKKKDDGDDNDEYSDDEDVDNKSSGNKKPSQSKDTSLMKPPKPYLEIIADAILSSQQRMMQLHEIYYYMEKKYPYFEQNVNRTWRNSVRHNLSLNECFVKACRGSNGKGNYWKIHSLCEPDFVRGNFRRKNFKQKIRGYQNGNQYVYPSSILF